MSERGPLCEARSFDDELQLCIEFVHSHSRTDLYHTKALYD